MREFEELCEGFGIMKKTTQERYPRQIRLSEDFLEALKKEYYDLKLAEDTEGEVKNRPAKFVKALRFHVADLENNSADELDAMRARFEESNDERVPEVKVDGEKLELPQNEAPKNTEPKDDKLCKCKRIVLKRNASSAPEETEIK